MDSVGRTADVVLAPATNYILHGNDVMHHRLHRPAGLSAGIPTTLSELIIRPFLSFYYASRTTGYVFLLPTCPGIAMCPEAGKPHARVYLIVNH